MIVDGKALAAEILGMVATAISRQKAAAPRMTVITCAPNFATQKYLALKRRKAAEVGIDLTVLECSATATTTDVVTAIASAIRDSDGVVVQLPLPPQIDREVVLQAIPATHDPDGFSYGTDLEACLPPVVAAIAEIASRYQVNIKGSKAVVVGQGRLVGVPVAHFLTTAGAEVTTLTAVDTFPHAAITSAEIIVSGVGQPRLIAPSDITPGVCVFDAGTAEDGGVLVGDVDPGVAAVAKLFTPVPGGIGPLTIACLLRNLVELQGRQ